MQVVNSQGRDGGVLRIASPFGCTRLLSVFASIGTIRRRFSVTDWLICRQISVNIGKRFGAGCLVAVSALDRRANHRLAEPHSRRCPTEILSGV